MRLSERARDLWRGAWPLLALALVVRVAQIAATHGWVPRSDPADYVRYAVSIAHGHGYPETLLPQGGPTALRPPAYPFFLGGVFAVVGDSNTAGRLVSALLGVVTVALIGLVADMLWSRRVAIASMALAAVYPPLVLVSGALLSEALALPLLLALVLLLIDRRRRPASVGAAAAAGLLFGLALLDRPALSVLVVPLVAALWGRPWRSVRAAALPAVALAVAALSVVPWTIRNAVEFHDFVPISDQSGFLIAGTYNETSAHDPVAPGLYRPANFVPSLRPLVFNRSLDENQLSRKLGAAGRRYARKHPGYVPRVLWWNGLRLLELSRPFANTRLTYEFLGIERGYADAVVVSFWLVALLAVAGLVLGSLRGVPAWLWITPLLLFVGVIWISSDVRYRLPIEPFLVWSAAVALVAAFERVRGRRPAPRPQPRQQPLQ
jgi:4-amino-4-deoxy-L-arabinose transferase-like glycosyltransferase